MCTKFSLFYQESYPMVVYWGAWQKMRLFTTILQLMFKMNQRQQAEAERKYELFEEITEELSRIKQARCEKANELSVVQSKEKKALWYKKQKTLHGVYWQIYLT